MNNARIRSFESFLATYNLTINQILSFTYGYGRKVLLESMHKNEAVGLRLGQLFIFGNQPIFTTKEWYDISDEWKEQTLHYKSIPVFEINMQGLKQDNKFNEELL